MVRRGGRTTASRTAATANNTLTSSSSGSNHHGSRWNRSRPHSANSGERTGMKGSKSVGSSTRSSPNGSSQSASVSPPAGKKGSGGKGARSSSYWRSRGSGSGRNSGGGALIDSKFSITNEDFPALPGVRGGGGTSHSTPNKTAKKERDLIERKGGSGNANVRNTRKSASKRMSELQADLISPDDSGVSSSSRGNTPIQEPHSVQAVSKVDRTDKDQKKKSAPADPPKRKSTPPAAKERPTRGNPKSVRAASIVQNSFGPTSPRKKSINTANSANTAPSFMKLSKLGQKVPERRGGTRVSNTQPPTSPSNPERNKENELKEEIESPPPSMVPIIEFIKEKEKMKQESQAANKHSVSPSPPPPAQKLFEPPSGVPKIVLSADGEMSNIPASMLTDQFGMAAMLPILDIVKNRHTWPDPAGLPEDKLSERILQENIELTSIGMDLNELRVPIKTADNAFRTIWQSFSGPFGSEPMVPTNMGLSYYQVPTVYYTARTLQTSFDMTQNIPDKFGVHELFYIFYNLPRELWQLNAARELQYRGWRFNIKEKLWVHKKLGEPDEYGISATTPLNPFTQPSSNQEDIMIGIFEIYDAEKARITSREMCLRRSEFEVPAWEQKTLDPYQKMVAALFPKEVLWGPRQDREKAGILTGMAGMVAATAGRSTGSKLPPNLVIPKQQSSSSARRLLSFADSPDLTPNFDSPFGSLPTNASSDDLYRQQMYAVLLQKMQQQQQLHQLQQKRPSAPSHTQAASSSNYF